jgi:hypothetical protein
MAFETVKRNGYDTLKIWRKTADGKTMELINSIKIFLIIGVGELF